MQNCSSSGQQQAYDLYQDKRIPVQDMHVYPYNNVLLVYSRHKKSIGTAFLIDQFHAITAAHNLFPGKRVFKDVIFYPYVTRNEISVRDSAFQSAIFKMSDCRYPEKFLINYSHKQKRLKHDYAVVKLSKPIIHEQYTKLLIDCDLDLKKSPTVEVVGFPGNHINRINSDVFEITAYYHSDKLIEKNENFLFYEAVTSKGQSGSPVFYKLKDTLYAVGIHIYGHVSTKKNQGIYLNKFISKKAREWMRQMYVADISMFVLHQDSVKQLQMKEDEGQQSQKHQQSWHLMKSSAVAKSFVNNASNISWEISFPTKNRLIVQNGILTNASRQKQSASLLTIASQPIDKIMQQKYKTTIIGIQGRIVIGITTQEGKRQLLEKMSIGNFKNYLIAYATENDKDATGLGPYGRVSYNQRIYEKYRKSEGKLFADKGQQIEFSINFSLQQVILIVKNEMVVKEAIPIKYRDKELYIYVVLEQSQDSIQIIKVQN